MRIAVVGTGAIGSYFGARLARSGEDVHFLARGAKLAAMRERGLQVRSVFGDFTLEPGAIHVTDDPGSVGPVEIVLFTVKAYDTTSAARGLVPLLGSDTGVVSLQNGVDNEERLAAEIDTDHVIGGVAFILARAGEPGIVHHTGGPTSIVFGELDGRSSARTDALLAACRRADLGAEITDDIRVALWSKFAFICAQAGLTAVTRLPIGDLRAVPEAWRVFSSIVEEAWRVGRAEGVGLPDDLVASQVAFAAGLPSDGRSSLHDDLVAGRRMELDALLGELVRRGDLAGEPVPVSRTLLGLLRPWQLRNEAPA
jgi:2-dehydropantoate 2-reductase